MARKVKLFIFSAILFLGSVLCAVMADPIEDKQALLDFLLKTPHSRPLNWNQDSPVCESWAGVACTDDRSRVTELHLPGIGFRGSIPPDILTRLSAIRVLSLRFNFFSGPLPQDFSVWKNLTVLDLSNNAFNGSIPSSLSQLSNLTSLDLANNSLSGEIPDLDLASLKQLNLANNNLTGVVPLSLERFPSWAFLGNNLSSGAAPKATKFGPPALLGILLGCCVVGFVGIFILIIACGSNNANDKKNPLDPSSQTQKKQVSLGKRSIPKNPDRDETVVFFDGLGHKFGLEDLLKSSADVLGKGTFGTTYRAALDGGRTVVVKRVAELTVAREKFEQLMDAVGRIQHENVAPLKAYFHSKDEKLLIYDYYVQGSVSSILHDGDRASPLDWEARLKIVIGTARGLACIHEQNGRKMVHGNLKGSNIFLNSQGFGCVSDIGLSTLMNPFLPALVRGAGYQAPEVTDTRKASQASDVYSFGVLVLEILTGKSPVHDMNGGALIRWVNSVVREWTAEAFDLELLQSPNTEDEIIEMLRIGMACVARMPNERPKMLEVVRMLERIRNQA